MHTAESAFEGAGESPVFTPLAELASSVDLRAPAAACRAIADSLGGRTRRDRSTLAWPAMGRA